MTFIESLRSHLANPTKPLGDGRPRLSAESVETLGIDVFADLIAEYFAHDSSWKSNAGYLLGIGSEELFPNCRLGEEQAFGLRRTPRGDQVHAEPFTRALSSRSGLGLVQDHAPTLFDAARRLRDRVLVLHAHFDPSRAGRPDSGQSIGVRLFHRPDDAKKAWVEFIPPPQTVVPIRRDDEPTAEEIRRRALAAVANQQAEILLRCAIALGVVDEHGSLLPPPPRAA